jgi:hypothetical protein
MFRRNEAMLSFLEGEIHNAGRTSQPSRALALKLILRSYRAGGDASRIRHLLAGVMPSSDAMLLVSVDHAEEKSAALLSLARVLGRVRRAAIVANAAVIAILLTIATLMAVACITAPGQYAILSQPSNMQTLKQNQAIKARQREIQLQLEADSGSPSDSKTP